MNNALKNINYLLKEIYDKPWNGNSSTRKVFIFGHQHNISSFFLNNLEIKDRTRKKRKLALKNCACLKMSFVNEEFKMECFYEGEGNEKPKYHYLNKGEEDITGLVFPGEKPGGTDNIYDHIEIYLARHGEAVHNIKKEAVPQNQWVLMKEKRDGDQINKFNTLLTPEGVAQAIRLSKYFETQKVFYETGDIVISSNLDRAIETCVTVLYKIINEDLISKNRMSEMSILFNKMRNERFFKNTPKFSPSYRFLDSKKIEYF